MRTLKIFLIEYLRLIGYTILGLVFAYSAFYLLINLYHEKELSRSFEYTALEDMNYTSILTKISQVEENISGFNSNKYRGKIPVHQLLNIQGRIQNCTKLFKTEALIGLQENEVITIKDIGNLETSLQNEVLSGCLVEQLFDMAVADETDRYTIPSLNNIAPYMELNIKTLLNTNSYLTTDISNNHIYYFTTEHTNTSLFNKLRLGYSELLSTYNKSADLLLEVSEWFKEEIGG